MIDSSRAAFEAAVRASQDEVVGLCRELLRIPSENPPGDTAPLVARIEAVLAQTPGVELHRIVAQAPAVNLVARLCGARPGRRLVINGHLDTFPAGDAAGWTVPPYAGEIRDGRLYGRGAGDMKAGVAAGLVALRLLAAWRQALGGELVLALAADEETGGKWGSEYLLDHVPEARGDAMLNGDAGAPQVLRFGEKGRMWLRIAARGKAAHGAHVHLGANAVRRLIAALERLMTLSDLPCAVPDEIAGAVGEAAVVSEPLSGAGESETLMKVTVNIGRIAGGTAVNLVPDHAEALADIRFPPGVTVDELVQWLGENLTPLPGITFEVLAANEPSWTSPEHEIVRLVRRNATALLGEGVVANMRVGFSDARFYRERGIPSVVYGPTPHNMGGFDEFVRLDDLFAVFYVHAMTAYDYMTAA